MPETQDGKYIFDKCYTLLCDISGDAEAWKSYKTYIRSLGFEYLGDMRFYVDLLLNLEAKLERIKILYFPTRQHY